jgi:hypothetical protein
MAWGMEQTLSCKYNLEGIYRTLGSCLIMWSVLLVGQLWLVMCIILFIIRWWPLQFLTCNMKTPKLNKSCGQSLMRPCWSIGFQNQISRDSWLITHNPIRMLSKLFMVMGTFLPWWLIKNALVYSITPNRSVGTPKKIKPKLQDQHNALCH